MKKNLESIKNNIINKKWTGYLWQFSHRKPKFYFKENIAEEDLENIQEMYLFDDNETAIHCKYLGSTTPQFFEHKLSYFHQNENYKIGEGKSYPSHLAKFGVNTVHFQTIYKKTSTLCGKAYTWEPVLEFFKGLNKE